MSLKTPIELSDEQLDQVTGGANGFVDQNTSPGNNNVVPGSGLGLVEETINRGGQTVNGQQFRDDVPPPG